jgi:8-oxo-dGTP diphosphatase
MIVTAAILRNEFGEILICQRPVHKSCPLLWEFPGGKLETGETLKECLKRECQEELGIVIEVGEEAGVTAYDYPTFSVEIHFFYAALLEGQPTSMEHNQILFVKPEEMNLYEFCPADVEIVQKLKKQL